MKKLSNFVPLFVTFFVALFVLACAAPAGWEKPMGQGTAIPTATTMFTSTPSPTIPPTITSTPGPDLSWAPVQNGMYADPAKYEDVIRNYYERSPDKFHGYATRYGPDSLAEEVLWRHVVEMADQFDHTGKSFAYLGGGAGYVAFEKDKYFLLDNRASEAWARIVAGETPISWVYNSGTGEYYYYRGHQYDIFELLELNTDEVLTTTNKDKVSDLINYDVFMKNVHKRYVGIIALKSPNDFGHEYCLYAGTAPFKKIGLVLVGDFAAQQDWTPFDPAEVGEPRVHLGQRVYFADDGSEWEWAADLPDSLFYQLSVDDAALLMLLSPEACDG